MRLEQIDSYQRAFSARVVEVSSFRTSAEGAPRPSLLLEASAFYPESGGQLADTGRIGDALVTDVQLDESGRVHHLFTGPPPRVGEEYLAEIDWARRREHMALHTGQHVLSRALLQVARAETVSSRLGASDCTIDVGRADLGAQWLLEAQALANQIVDEARPVTAWLPTDSELAALKLRRAPKVTDGIRVVSVADFDDTPCGGTHVANTSEIGLVWICSNERYKGGTRVHFSAGPRARAELFRRSQALAGLAAQLGTGIDDLQPAISRLEHSLREARGEQGRLRAELADSVATATAWHGPRALVELAGDLDLARAVVERLTRRPDAEVLVAVAVDAGTQLIIARGATSGLDAGATLKRIAGHLGGRGGGKPERAEGRLPAPIDLTAVLKELGI